MIVPMKKVFVVARNDDRQRLLTALRDLGVVHLVPVDPAKAVAAEATLARIDTLRRAIQILTTVEVPQGAAAPDAEPLAAAEEVLAIHRASAEGRARLAALARQVDELAVWGDARIEQFAALRAAGVEVRFHAVPADEVRQIRAECVQVLAESFAPGRVLVAVIDRAGQAELPESAEPVPLPPRDRPTVRAEAAEVDRALQAGAARVKELAPLVGKMESALKRLRGEAEFSLAETSGLDEGPLYALQGWVPQDQADALPGGLAQAGIDAGTQLVDPAEDENPPTLIRYPKWARPIQGLFEILGTHPGYREFDVSGFFMIAFPIFAAMLIGDAGYGLIFLLLAGGLYKKLSRAAGKAKTNLLLVIGAVTLVWGVLSGNYFGITPDKLAAAGGYTTLVDGKTVTDVGAIAKGTDGYAAAARAMIAVAPLWSADGQVVLFLLIKVSFVMALIHLCAAHLRQALGIFPDLRFLSELGWVAFLCGMFGVIWQMFFIGLAQPWNPLIFVALLAGAGLAILFTYPARNPAKRVGIGLASSILPALGAFSDTMSYIRLMAVGLASFYIANAFNGIGAMVASSATWLAGAPIVIFGHALNIGLAAIAIFAHGVRLNMLEFSSNAGVQWAGYAYTPFATTDSKES